jgi:hypothetical protein
LRCQMHGKRNQCLIRGRERSGHTK